MADIKNFGIKGIASDVQMGKSGGRLKYDSANGRFDLTQSDGSTLEDIRIGSVTSGAWTATAIGTQYGGTGVDLSSRSPIVGDVIWSTSVQHGPGGCARIFERAFQSLGTTNPSDAAIIEAVYNERGRDNGSAYFGRSTPAVRASVVRRFQNEKADGLRYLAQWSEAQERPVLASTDDVNNDTPTVG